MFVRLKSTHQTYVSAKENTLTDNHISLTLKSCLFLLLLIQVTVWVVFKFCGEAPRIPTFRHTPNCRNSRLHEKRFTLKPLTDLSPKPSSEKLKLVPRLYFIVKNTCRNK